MLAQAVAEFGGDFPQAAREIALPAEEARKAKRKDEGATRDLEEKWHKGADAWGSKYVCCYVYIYIYIIMHLKDLKYINRTCCGMWDT